MPSQPFERKAIILESIYIYIESIELFQAVYIFLKDMCCSFG